MSERDGLTPLQRAQQLLAERKPREALRIVDQILVQRPKSWSAHMRHGKIMEWLGQFDRAHAAFDRAGEHGASSDLVKQAKQRVETVKDALDRAKKSLNLGEAAQALHELEIAQRLRSTAIVDLHLARALFATGKPQRAQNLVDTFLAERPGHKLARRLSREIDQRLSRSPGDGVAKRSKEARSRGTRSSCSTRNSESSNRGAFRLKLADRLQRIELAIPNDIAEIRNQSAWLTRNSERIGKSNWSDDKLYAKAAHFLFARNTQEALDNYDPYLIEKSVQFGYITWPKRIQKYIRHRRILDIGCGFGAYGNAFLVAGAAEYVGIDPRMPLDSTAVKDKRNRCRADIGITPRQIMARCPNIRLIPGVFEDLITSERFGAVVLHNVTEHLHQIREVIADIPRLLEPDGRIVFHHHNFYCWNGHHLPPNKPHKYQPGDPKQDQLVDWNHIVVAPQLPSDHYIHTGLNRIRLDALKAVVERHFAIEAWREIESPSDVAKRLTDEVRARLGRFDPTLSRRDLMVNAVLCIARPRAL